MGNKAKNKDRVKITKGMKGYISKLKRTDILFILSDVIIAAVIFIVGMMVWKEKGNIATVVAVCAMLPACKRVVNLILIFKFKGISNDDYDTIINKCKHEADFAVNYADMLFSTEQYFLLFKHAVLTENKLLAYSDMGKEKNEYATEYLKKGFSIRGIDVHVKIYSDVREYASARAAALENNAETDTDAVSYINSLLV